MLRTVLKLLLSLSLVLQGPLPVLAAISARAQADDCMQAMAQQGGGAEKKVPCCVGDCPPAACVQACLAGLAAFLAPGAPGLAPSDSAHAHAPSSDTSVVGRDEGPPIRPPIA
ncbi:MAG: hypothetical protein J0I77_00445 [Rudaea sp.]|uniref:hypothetical protein n=1 Tax=unclassified Rudaea TaxID=2627037 RepID=UPI0010FA6302|nr:MULTISPECIES: hypothetical protein [unclassified Rudaea]MBN8884161.1 hypothetical protein [Rudaea sp.]